MSVSSAAVVVLYVGNLRRRSLPHTVPLRFPTPDFIYYSVSSMNFIAWDVIVVAWNVIAWMIRNRIESKPMK
jgi:hypothetical protein